MTVARGILSLLGCASAVVSATDAGASAARHDTVTVVGYRIPVAQNPVSGEVTPANRAFFQALNTSGYYREMDTGLCSAYGLGLVSRISPAPPPYRLRPKALLPDRLTWFSRAVHKGDGTKLFQISRAMPAGSTWRILTSVPVDAASLIDPLTIAGVSLTRDGQGQLTLTDVDAPSRCGGSPDFVTSTPASDKRVQLIMVVRPPAAAARFRPATVNYAGRQDPLTLSDQALLLVVIDDSGAAAN